MKRSYLFFFITELFLMLNSSMWAQDNTSQQRKEGFFNQLEYRMKAGFNIGGTSPIPLPAEIRSIKSWSPKVAAAVEVSVTKWFSNAWGMETGIRLENKCMETDARVKNYNMAMVANDGGQMSGSWTGYVKTNINNSYVSLPILVVYQLKPKWILKAGFELSYLTVGEFNGTAYNGYLRNENPIGEKVEVSEALYDFSDHLRKINSGLLIGCEWRIKLHLSINTHLTWGLNNVFESDFETIKFKMYPIYINLGFGYVF